MGGGRQAVCGMVAWRVAVAQERRSETAAQLSSASGGAAVAAAAAAAAAVKAAAASAAACLSAVLTPPGVASPDAVESHIGTVGAASHESGPSVAVASR